MGYIHCCSGLRKAKSYSLIPEKKYLLAQVDFLEECPVCGHTIVQLTRIDFDNKVTVCRKINQKARVLFEHLKKSIQYEKKSSGDCSRAYSKFYLNYNEFGVKKKCYSNLSTLKIGLFEDENIRSNERIMSLAIRPV